MTNSIPQAYRNLEFDKILPLLSKYIKTYPGNKELEKIRILSDRKLIQNELDLTSQMMEFLKIDGSLAFEEIENIDDSLKNSGKDGFILAVDEILEIKKTLDMWVFNIESIKNHSEKYPLINSSFNNISNPDSFIKKINRIMDNNGNFFDGASEELKRIRKRRGSVRQDIQHRLSSIMESERMQEVLQDKIITIRDGRFVIPFKSQFKNKVKADMNFIVHSFSKSGETSFVEPEAVIHLNNELVEIDEMEWIEIRRILKELTEETARLSDIIQAIFLALGRLEFLYAKAKFAIDFHCGFPEIIERPASFKLVNAFHPLLGSDAIPINIEIGFTCNGIVISGPNAGGKTVALKTAGILVLMVLSGIPIPADSRSKVGLFTGIMAEIGDEQNISENLSSFSGHILSIARILSECGSTSLVLIDEIAGSTEPKEGEALGREIINYLAEKGTKFIITTHYQGIKEIAYTDPRVKNAFVEFDEERLVPLYRLHTGGTGSSYALKAAKKYGLEDSIIKKAEEYLVKTSTESEKILKSLEADKNLLSKRREIVVKQIEESKRIRDDYQIFLKRMEEEKKEAEKKGVSLLKRELDAALKEIVSLRQEVKNKRILDIKSIDKKIEEIQTVLKKEEIEILEEEKKHPETIFIGQTVYIGSLKKEGYVEEFSGNRVKVRIGIISTVVDKSDIFLPDSLKEIDKKNFYHISEELNSMPYVIDIRGKSLEEAMKIVEKNLDLAVINGSASIFIIHGKGEGVLRKAVWDYLKTLDFIKNFHYAKPDEGGQGKTIVLLK